MEIYTSFFCVQGHIKERTDKKVCLNTFIKRAASCPEGHKVTSTQKLNIGKIRFLSIFYLTTSRNQIINFRVNFIPLCQQSSKCILCVLLRTELSLIFMVRIKVLWKLFSGRFFGEMITQESTPTLPHFLASAKIGVNKNKYILFLPR